MSLLNTFIMKKKFSLIIASVVVLATALICWQKTDVKSSALVLASVEALAGEEQLGPNWLIGYKMGDRDIKVGKDETTGISGFFSVTMSDEEIIYALGITGSGSVTIHYETIYCCVSVGNDSTACNTDGEYPACDYLVR